MDRETVDEIKHEFDIVMEQLRGDLRLVAAQIQALREDVRAETEASRGAALAFRKDRAPETGEARPKSPRS